MNANRPTNGEATKELEQLRIQLQEAMDIIQAIRTGQVDAIVVESEKGHELYKLKSADQTYRVFIEKMKEGAVTLNHDGIILYSNTQFASMVGLPLAKVVGNAFIDLVPEAYRDTYSSLFTQGWNSDSKGEVALVNGEGKAVPILLSFTSLELDEGVALSIILTDLTLQKKTERKLKIQNELLEASRRRVAQMNEELEDIVRERTRDLLVSREHFRFLADNIPVIVWTAKPGGSIDYINNRWTRYTGFTLEDTHAGLQVAMHAHDKLSYTGLWKEKIRKESRFEFECRLKRNNDEVYRWHLGHAVPFRDAEGNITAWFGTLTDIEDQKQEMEKKDEFISVASHELKTPLTSLKAYIQLINRNKDLPEDINFYVKKANESVTKLQNLISDLLDVSRIQAGKLKFNLEPVDIGKLVIACIENAGYIFSSHTIRTEVENGLTVQGNAERLEQVVMNLLTNATKYSPEGSEIVICVEAKDGEVIVSVTDAGIGLSESNLQRIFERFYRVENTKVPAAGLGMGLYISAEIIREHGGRMEVRSKLNAGSCFSFSLPLTQV
jgi:two-component system phosphate regulon sensor histidine kinase PhoR